MAGGRVRAPMTNPVTRTLGRRRLGLQATVRAISEAGADGWLRCCRNANVAGATDNATQELLVASKARKKVAAEAN
jgi:hypothetical protein